MICLLAMIYNFPKSFSKILSNFKTGNFRRFKLFSHPVHRFVWLITKVLRNGFGLHFNDTGIKIPSFSKP